MYMWLTKFRGCRIMKDIQYEEYWIVLIKCSFFTTLFYFILYQYESMLDNILKQIFRLRYFSCSPFIESGIHSDTVISVYICIVIRYIHYVKMFSTVHLEYRIYKAELVIQTGSFTTHQHYDDSPIRYNFIYNAVFNLLTFRFIQRQQVQQQRSQR